MRILVTGGAGFIGANLAARLLTDDHEVVVIDDLSTGNRANLAGLDVTFVEASILDSEALTKAASGVEAIVHLAALGSVPRSVRDPIASHHANATGTLQVLQAARAADNAHTIVASSSSVYGANPTLPKAETLRPQPMSPYAVSKLATETYTLAFGKVYALPVLAFRFFNVFGPLQPAGHDYAAVIPVFLDAALRGEPLPIHGDGRQSRDFTYVDSVTGIISEAIRRKVTNDEPINLAFGGRRTLLEVIEQIEIALDSPLELLHLPIRNGDVRHSQAHNGRLREVFPEAVEVPFVAGLKQTLTWFRNQRL